MKQRTGPRRLYAPKPQCMPAACLGCPQSTPAKVSPCRNSNDPIHPPLHPLCRPLSYRYEKGFYLLYYLQVRTAMCVPASCVLRRIKAAAALQLQLHRTTRHIAITFLSRLHTWLGYCVLDDCRVA